MISISEPKKMQEKSLEIKRKTDQGIGLVPTMGYLHEGHLSLIEKARKLCGIVIVSIFVNPIQFGENEDYDSYPRDLERDKRLLIEKGVDFLFMPNKKEMYEQDHKTYIEVEGLSKIMCGKFRPGHFKGVCTVVNKLFNITQPDKAFFGKKDYQQFIILKRMTQDLNMPVDIIGCPTVREEDGLALSSRNKYLNASQRKSALLIFKSLKQSERSVKNGEKDMVALSKKQKKALLGDENIKKVDYYDFRDPLTLGEIDTIKNEERLLVATAATVGKTRLIDNMIIGL